MKLWPAHYDPPRYPKYNFLERVEIVTGVPIGQLRLSSRHKEICRLRQAVAHVMHDTLGRSYGEIGISLNRNHSTIIHGVNQSRQLISKCDRHRALVDSLEAVA